MPKLVFSETVGDDTYHHINNQWYMTRIDAEKLREEIDKLKAKKEDRKLYHHSGRCIDFYSNDLF